jgi:hypothetical protein
MCVTPYATSYWLDTTKDDKKKRHFLSAMFNRYRSKNIGELTQDWADVIKEAKHFSNDEIFDGAWLFIILKETPRTVSNSEFGVALKFRLGIHFTILLPGCCCSGQTQICNHRRHLFSCNEFKNTMPSNMSSKN